MQQEPERQALEAQTGMMLVPQEPAQEQVQVLAEEELVMVSPQLEQAQAQEFRGEQWWHRCHC